MTDEEFTAERLMTTHGADGALLGTDFVNLSRGQTQCPYVKRYTTGFSCCALVKGHRDGHRDGYLGNQSAQSKWVLL